jgi:hypothetical protein
MWVATPDEARSPRLQPYGTSHVFFYMPQACPIACGLFLSQKEEKGEDAKYFSNKLSPSQKKKQPTAKDERPSDYARQTLTNFWMIEGLRVFRESINSDKIQAHK